MVRIRLPPAASRLRTWGVLEQRFCRGLRLDVPPADVFITYDVTAQLIAADKISARVYRGVPLLGRTEILIRDPQLSLDGRC
jgi:hypothetical protein